MNLFRQFIISVRALLFVVPSILVMSIFTCFTRIRSKTKTKTGESEEEGLGKRGDQWTEVLSLKPRAFLYHNFLSKEECEHLITLAKPHMKRSKVADRLTGTGVESSGRTSTGMFLRRGADKVVKDIEKRIADYISIPVEHGEQMQILHYEVGQKFDAHYDTSHDEVRINKNGGQRMATFIMYLTDVEKGGETVFPKAEANPEPTPHMSKKKGISVKPKMGDALFFWSMHPDLTVDPSSLHGSRPVIKGDKWSATKWMHVYKCRA